MRSRQRLAGLLFAVLLLGTCALSTAVYLGAFRGEAPVLLRTDRVGNQLQVGSEVKLLGVPIGRVRAVRATGDGAEIELGIDPEQVGLVPGNTTARLLPKTLFGERYVSLEAPARPSGALAAGDVIDQDRSGAAVELERVLADLMPTLQAVRPDKLSTALTSIATALRGRGEHLGDTVVELDEHLRAFAPDLPALTEDLGKLAGVAEVYAGAGDDLVSALADATTTSRTLARQRADLAALHRNLTTAADDLTGFVSANSGNLVALAGSARPSLELFAEHAPSYRCVLRAVDRLRPAVDQALGEGGDQPGLHGELVVVPGRAGREPGPRAPGHPCPQGPANPVAPGDVPGWAGLLLGTGAR
ncbi:MCE family protein [Actinosynnema pretiosum]|uniref:ABC transporter substrate-binding protein n=1 Tax=Actinosynnema pretiosum TaxID=42197 RepID=A0A290Z425_9PSEU|nr:MCE family protein [Actinosynnema pretiosum]ATE53758.1 ABC transporter substrate-binding protein [Actinosynnema pretiosum]